MSIVLEIVDFREFSCGTGLNIRLSGQATADFQDARAEVVTDTLGKIAVASLKFAALAKNRDATYDSLSATVMLDRASVRIHQL